MASLDSSITVGFWSTSSDAGGLIGVWAMPIDVPQSAQNDFPTGDLELHFGHNKNCDAPHSEQKRFSF
jgi:hypothetical protein